MSGYECQLQIISKVITLEIDLNMDQTCVHSLNDQDTHLKLRNFSLSDIQNQKQKKI